MNHVAYLLSLLTLFISLQSKIEIVAEPSLDYNVDPRPKINVVFEGNESSLNSLNYYPQPEYNNVNPLLKVDKKPENLVAGENIKELKNLEKILKSEAVMGYDLNTTGNIILSDNASEIERDFRNVRSALDVKGNDVDRNSGEHVYLEMKRRKRNPRYQGMRHVYGNNVNSENKSNTTYKVNDRKLPDNNEDKLDNFVSRQDSNKNNDKNFRVKGKNDESSLKNTEDDNIRNASDVIISPGILELRKPNGISNEQLRRIHRTRKDHLLKRHDHAQFYFSDKNTHLENKNRYDEGVISMDNNEVDHNNNLLPLISSSGIKNLSNNLRALHEISGYIDSKSNRNSPEESAKLAETSQNITDSESYNSTNSSTQGESLIRANRSIPLHINEDDNEDLVGDPDLASNANLASLQQSPSNNFISVPFPCVDKNTKYASKIDYNETFPLWMFNLDSKSRINEICRLDREELARENELQKIELEKIKKFNEILQLQLQEQLLRNTNNFQPSRVQRTILAGTETDPIVKEVTNFGSRVPNYGVTVKVQNGSGCMYKADSYRINEVEDDLNDGNISLSNSSDFQRGNFSELNGANPKDLPGLNEASMNDEKPSSLYKVHSLGLREDKQARNDDYKLAKEMITKLSNDDFRKLNFSSFSVNDINTDDFKGNLASFISDNVLKVKDPRIIKTLKRMDTSLLSFPTAFDYSLQSKEQPHKIKQRSLLDELVSNGINYTSNVENNSKNFRQSQTNQQQNLGNISLSEDDSFNNIPLSSYLREEMGNISLGSDMKNQSIGKILNLLEPFFSEGSIVLSNSEDDAVPPESTVNENKIPHQKMNKKKTYSAKLLSGTANRHPASNMEVIRIALPQKNDLFLKQALSFKNNKSNEFINKLNDLFNNASIKLISPLQLNSARNSSPNLKSSGWPNLSLDSLLGLQDIVSRIKLNEKDNKTFDSSNPTEQISNDENIFSKLCQSNNSNRTGPKPSFPVKPNNRQNNFSNDNFFNNQITTKKNPLSSNFFNGDKYYGSTSSSIKSNFNNNNYCMTPSACQPEEKMTTGNCLKVIGFIFECNNTQQPFNHNNFNSSSVRSKNFSRESDGGYITKKCKVTCDDSNINNDVTANLELNQPSGTMSMNPTINAVDPITSTPDFNPNLQPNDLPFLKNIFSILQSLIVLQNNKTKDLKPTTIGFLPVDDESLIEKNTSVENSGEVQKRIHKIDFSESND